MGFFSEIDIEIMEMIRDGATREQVSIEFPLLDKETIEQYFTGDHDADDDRQPDEYTEWQDYMGGDDWDHGQYDGDF